MYFQHIDLQLGNGQVEFHDLTECEFTVKGDAGAVTQQVGVGQQIFRHLLGACCDIVRIAQGIFVSPSELRNVGRVQGAAVFLTQLNFLSSLIGTGPS